MNKKFFSGKIYIMLLSFFLVSQSSRADQKFEHIDHEFNGLKIFYKKERQHAIDLENHLEKCKWDSPTFREVLYRIEKQQEELQKFISITVYRASEEIYFLQATDDIDQFWIDLDGLEIFPNPIKISFGEFIPIPHTPKWAEYLCSALGHELAEHWSMMQNSAKSRLEKKKFDRDEDRKISHCDVANKFGDRITKDYFGSDRVRGENYSVKHLDHHDAIIEIPPYGAIILHKSPDRVDFSDSSSLQMQPRRRLAYISYESDFVAPASEKKAYRECQK